ncbi:MAG: glycine cleavage system aminomethyltransferase GcvT [Sorangiineae bacterium]|nr:glycine cleavage system aminomethyltransferase GcvT [Polyangiaceae bacterium]MEB2323312.1 glycine cleavage system aminomethyltransferase GcvT [Sorangiineae bacterium]
MTDELARTPLYEEHRRLGGRLVPFAGWEMPVQYAGIAAEHRAVRQRAGLFDVSHMGELELDGEHAASVVDSLVTNALARTVPGQALYTCACGENGTILDDLIVYRRAPDRLLVVCNASNRAKMSAHFAAAARGRCDFADVSDSTALIALQGPRALGILARADQALTNVRESLSPFHFRETTVAGVASTVARTGYTGEDGVEIFCGSADAPALWRALLEAGKEDGLEPAGLGARDTLRLEARLSLYGNDIDETTNPLEAGLGWTVKFDKGDFLGRDALLRVKARGLARKLVGFEMTGRGVARHGYPLLDGAGEPIGVCTSGGPAPTLDKNIGLGYLPVSMSEVGAAFRVDCRGKAIDAVVVKTPFYKRPKDA